MVRARERGANRDSEPSVAGDPHRSEAFDAAVDPKLQSARMRLEVKPNGWRLYFLKLSTKKVAKTTNPSTAITDKTIAGRSIADAAEGGSSDVDKVMTFATGSSAKTAKTIVKTRLRVRFCLLQPGLACTGSFVPCDDIAALSM